jgi:hypothetical protein
MVENRKQCMVEYGTHTKARNLYQNIVMTKEPGLKMLLQLDGVFFSVMKS